MRRLGPPALRHPGGLCTLLVAVSGFLVCACASKNVNCELDMTAMGPILPQEATSYVPADRRDAHAAAPPVASLRSFCKNQKEICRRARTAVSKVRRELRTYFDLN